jgi:hypothetical protein
LVYFGWPGRPAPPRPLPAEYAENAERIPPIPFTHLAAKDHKDFKTTF